MIQARTKLEELIGELEGTDFKAVARPALAAMLSAAADATADLEPFTHFVPGRYTRNLVFRNDEFELLVLCWSAGSGSPVHDHGGMNCFFVVTHGTLRIDDYALVCGGLREGYAHIAPAGSNVLGRGGVDMRSSDRDLHRVGPLGGDAISVHVYAKPIERFMVYDVGRRSCRRAFSRYDRAPAAR